MDEKNTPAPETAVVHRPGDPGSRKNLRPGSAAHYPGTNLFDRLARVICEVDGLPRKELYEAWETARRVRRRFRGGRVVDLAAGHGLLAYVMLLLDEASPSALAVDLRRPALHARLSAALEDAWPRLAGRVTYVEGRLEDVVLEPGDVVVSAHACGHLTDAILDLAIAARVPVAVLPCCHVHEPHHPLAAWLPPDLCADVDRAWRLRAAGYDVRAQLIPGNITPKNRLLLAIPRP